MTPVAPDCSEVTITDVTILGEVEISNDAGNPVPVSFANDPTHLEDAAFANGDRGNLVLGVRNDASAATTTTDGDYSQISTDSSGRVKTVVEVEVASTFTHGQNTDVDSGSEEQIVVGSNPSYHGVIIKALSTNTGTIYVGLVGVTAATGYPLDAGETVTIPVDNANKVYAIASVDNQGLAWMAA